MATKSVVSDFNAAEEREERRGCCIIHFMAQGTRKSERRSFDAVNSGWVERTKRRLLHRVRMPRMCTPIAAISKIGYGGGRGGVGHGNVAAAGRKLGIRAQGETLTVYQRLLVYRGAPHSHMKSCKRAAHKERNMDVAVMTTMPQPFFSAWFLPSSRSLRSHHCVCCWEAVIERTSG